MLNPTEMIEYLEQDEFSLDKDILNNIIDLLKKLDNLESRIEKVNAQKEVGCLYSIDLEDLNLTDIIVKELVHNMADYILKNKLYNFKLIKDDSLDVNLYKCELDVVRPND